MMGNTHSPGFTLIELAIVLFIIALILGGLLTPLATKLELEERKQTSEKLEEVRSSLLGFAIVNGHLPCPDCPNTTTGQCNLVATQLGADKIGDGIEDGIDSGGNASNDRSPPNQFLSCATLPSPTVEVTSEGNLPWVTLGVDEFDSWENHFRYRVNEDFADDTDGTGCGTPATNVSFEICSTGNINVNDGTGASVAQNVPAVVVSFGKNASETGNPSSASEIENQDGDTTFIQKDYVTSSGTDEFDDLLMWLPSSSLIYRMVQAERLP